MMVEEKEVHVYTRLRNVGSNGSVQVSSQLFLRGSTIVLYHLWSMGVHTVKVKTEKRASTLALKPRLSIPVSVLQIRICYSLRTRLVRQNPEWKAWVQGYFHAWPVKLGAQYENIDLSAFDAGYPKPFWTVQDDVAWLSQLPV